jgi:hypothetical protein
MTVVSSNVRQGAYGPNYIASMEAADLIRAGIYQKVFKQYGRLYGMHDFLMSAGNEVALPAQDLKVVEEYAPKWPLKIKTAIAKGDAGGDITIVLDTATMVSNVHQARVGFSVKIPATYMPAAFNKDGIYRIKALSTTTVTNDTLTCEAFLAGDTYTKQQIATEVPAGTYIDCSGYSSFARGSGQPEGTYDYPVTRTYTWGIVKETKGFDGGTMAHEGEVAEYNGKNWLLSKSAFDAEFRLKDQVDDMILFGEDNDNSAMVTTSTMSTQSQAVRSTRGIISWLDDAGQKIYYTDSPTLTILDDIQDALLTQGVYTTTVTLFCSPKFYRDIQKEAKDYLREYSGGSDFLDGAKTAMGVNLETILWGGMTFYLHVVGSLADPASAGLTISDELVYAAGGMAIAVPDAKATVAKWGAEANVTIPNLFLGSLEYNGEIRRNVAKRYLGVNGVYETVDVASELDGWKLFWMRELMLAGAEWNKMILIRKQK